VVRGTRLTSVALLLVGVAAGGERVFSPRVPVAPAAAPYGAPATGVPSTRGISTSSPVSRKIHALLAGDAVLVRSIALVPIHAPVPSLARLPATARPIWESDTLQARSVSAQTLLLRSAGAHRALIVPGRVYVTKAGQLRPMEPIVTLLSGSAFVRGTVVGSGGAVVSSRWMDALATGRLLSGESVGAAAFSTDLHAGGLQAKRLLHETRGWHEQFGGTIVGIVALVGGEPVFAAIFGDRSLFESSRRDLVAITVATARRRVIEGVPNTVLRRRAERANSQGRAVAFLRDAVAERGTQRELAGSDRFWSSRDSRRTWIAQALLDHEGRLTYFGVWRVPPRAAVAQPGARPRPPKADPDEDPKLKKPGRLNPFRNTRSTKPASPTVPSRPDGPGGS
jgi:hypothetical protein